MLPVREISQITVFLSVFIVLPRNDRNLLLYTLRKLKVGLGDTYRS